MWEWGHLLWLLLLITFDNNGRWGAGHFSVWFLVLFLFFLAKCEYIMFVGFFRCFGDDVLGSLCVIEAFTLCCC